MTLPAMRSGVPTHARPAALKLLMTALGIGLLSLVASCASANDAEAPWTPPTNEVTPPEDELIPLVSIKATRGQDKFRNVGTADVAISEISLDGGEVSVVPGRDDLPALGFPPFRDGQVYPRAVLAVSNSGRQDLLSPGSQDVVWGADFRLDGLSVGIDADNGDNLLQRGLSSQPVMYKAEVDLERAGCEIVGDEGTLIVRTDEFLVPGQWYRVHCTRSGNTLTVELKTFEPTGTITVSTKSVEGRVGSVDFTDPTIPLTVGGKVGLDGEILASASDQFNGQVMNPFVALLADGPRR